MSSKIITDGTEILTDEQADELWELGNSGAQNAATALSSLIGVPISITVQKIIMVRLENLQNYLDDSIASMVVFQVRGQVSGNGSIILHVPKKSIIRLSSIMLAAPDEDREISEMDMSMLHEIGNIMTSSYLDACANLLSLMLIPSPPSMVIDMPHAVIQSVIAGQEFDEELDQILLFKTDMHCAEFDLEAGLLLLPSKSLLHELLERFRKVKADKT
ncbi:chemotaxis protein CheC [Methanospirillum sp. J.3.6.1-F.2.7.3]|jgi:chemotaxis protein CheY-P-specific phosphatase CheC|uniref:Chemotaxis protein CheC n=2 Tax=Methanospirillum TaxID=2202 RepID=A0A8E7B4R9_9EURY|nr:MULTISPECIES: chemotaxis protein CheC [Methanospirillum]MDX8550023.1 chemotaxis protein CheC [Methanospirillum hungatei]NLW76843.1 chemotaxis protein CheC [Methanomicrobiales archaeon]QVV90467.1 chemotaxis protein CheC [Methanospirillum sp. J.3.6.1-F.2.7.3]QXO94853.1 chemotaxis protein CheC [Methanospirillum hungatei]